MPLTLQITDAGRAALVNAGHDGTNAVRVATVGVSPTAIVAGPGTAALPGELKRIATISGEAVAADVLHMVVRDESADSYTLRSFALYLEDGTLFAAYGQADPIIEKSVQSLLLLAIDVALTDVSADQVTFGDGDFLNPPATTERQGVIEIATDAEALALVDKLRALTPAGLAKVFTAANILSRLLTVDGAGSGLDADTVDGRQAAEFALLTGAPFTGQVSLGGGLTEKLRLTGVDAPYLAAYNIAGTRTGYLQFSGTGVTLACDASNVVLHAAGAPRVVAGASSVDARVPLTQNGYQVWHLGNDGSGSGLDADMLDGKHASAFALLSGAAFSSAISGTSATMSDGFFVDPKFYIAANVGAPTNMDIAFDTGDVLRFSRTSNQLVFITDGITQAIFGASGNTINGYLKSNTDLRATDDNHRLYVSGTAAVHLFDTNDFFYFDRSANSYSWAVGGTARATLGAAGAFNVTGPLTQAGSQVWHIANDGSGSGLDADLLDGKQGSEYALLSGAAFSGAISALGVTLPGDTNASLNINRFSAANPNSIINIPADSAALIVQSAGNIAFRVKAGGIDTPGSINSGGAITQAGSQVWHVANDGAGSGLDADLLDGWQRDQVRDWGNLLNKPATFPPSAHTHTAADIAAAFTGALGANGYIVLPNGLILQWVAGATMAAGSETTQFVALPITFPSQCYRAFASTNITSANAFGDALFQVVGSPAVNGVTVMRQHVSSEADNVSSYPTVWAIGK